MTEVLKECQLCHQMLPKEQFYKRKDRNGNPNWTMSYCGSCDNIKVKESNLKDLLYDLNNILNIWISAKFTKIKETRKRVRINGKRKEIYDYQLDYKKIYKDNKQDLSILDIVRKSMYYNEKDNI
jgi:hypothetical protein